VPVSLLILTGASGAGKTTLVDALARRHRPGLHTYHFDSIGVPSAEAMIAQFGSGEGWQAAMTGQWIERLASNPDGAAAMVLEGQMRPHVIRGSWPAASAVLCRIILVDCAPEIRRARLAGPRAQPELANSQMDAWAAYLRGQADALGLPIVDTSAQSIEQGVSALEALLLP